MSAPRPRCYVASPLGFAESGRHYYGDVLLPALRPIVDIADPWELVSDDEIARASAAGVERELALEIGRRNADALRSCQLLVAVLDGQEVDAGTAAEVGFGAALGLRCFGIRTDRRQSGEPGATVNLQVESFIVASGGEIVASLADLVEVVGFAARGQGASAVAVR